MNDDVGRQVDVSRRIPSSLLLALVSGAFFLVAPGSAQERWTPSRVDRDPLPRALDVSLSVGALYSTDWSDLVVLGTIGGATGTFQQVLLRDLSVHPGPMGNVAVTYWEGRYGFRVHGGFSRSCLAVGPACARAPPPAPPGDGTPFPLPEEEIGIDTWLIDVAGIVGFRDGEDSRWWRPYFLMGGGAVAYDPDVEIADLLHRFVDVPRQEPAGDGAVRVIVDDTEAFLLSMDEVGFATSWAWTLGLGSDFRVPLGDGGIGLRMELTSHTSASPLRVRVLPLDGRRRGRREADGVRTLDFGSVHTLRFTTGLLLEVPLR